MTIVGIPSYGEPAPAIEGTTSEEQKTRNHVQNEWGARYFRFPLEVILG